MIPTHAECANALSTRIVGARLAEGPWQHLGPGRWGVPVVTYISRHLMPDKVVRLVGKRWVAEAPRDVPGRLVAPETLQGGWKW